MRVVVGIISASIFLLCSSGWAQTFDKEKQPSALDIRGLVKASDRVEISTDIVAAITETPFRDGERFRKGDILIRLDCGQYRAELTAARAAVNSARLEYNQKVQLKTYGAAGKGEVDIAASRFRRSEAEAEALAERLRRCEIPAPFDGRVVAMNVAVSEFPEGGGSPLMIVLDDRRLEIEFVAPSHWLRWIAVDWPFAFEVDETGETLNGSIERIAAEVDPISQTIRIIGRIDGEKGRTLAGMSGNVQILSETTGAISR
ncbi:efflux RND transporter periplasmic adaptor subunit [Notoacmeibacter ruber]|uniref:Efflux RND transporter periplasmic adaptor subunit n=1 Tax=Notoacmeibacter ruber TaxID=2670375 RepID=A0A3L7JCS4_9HYPH|nr:efflux RND transporter periplasmic adaptor subunit [Notoacmeibacter ruber]RLQ88115.1 efflux RND transporter periplasmic adaptor subunit [Notoacmeibacter ruber]